MAANSASLAIACGSERARVSVAKSAVRSLSVTVRPRACAPAIRAQTIATISSSAARSAGPEEMSRAKVR
jgi:hypothetical protein